MNTTSDRPARLQDTKRRILELELLRVRLEARAVELERQIQQLRLGGFTLDEVPGQSSRVRGRPAAEVPKQSGRAQRRKVAKVTEVPKQSGRAQRRKVAKVTEVPKQSGRAQRRKVAKVRRRPLLSRFSRRQRALLVSGVTHLFLLLLLAMIGLRMQEPRDQISFAASVSASEASAMESFTIETSEPNIEPEMPTPSETDYEISPVGELSASELFAESEMSEATTAMTTLSQSASASAATLSSKPATSEKMEFCGVEGGGNHFVYLVDSSKSMGQAFPLARAELLRSIRALQPDQRFYVVFFDAQPDYMQITNSKEDDPSSLSATSEHISGLERWAMGIQMDSGRAPYDSLRFALGLRPDVIFLLSDGEFPQGIEDLLQEENQVENLFGDRSRISIVHTIGYHSQQGEQRMRRIADQNGGQYRYVPKP